MTNRRNRIKDQLSQLKLDYLKQAAEAGGFPDDWRVYGRKWLKDHVQEMSFDSVIIELWDEVLTKFWEATPSDDEYFADPQQSFKFEGHDVEKEIHWKDPKTPGGVRTTLAGFSKVSHYISFASIAMGNAAKVTTAALIKFDRSEAMRAAAGGDVEMYLKDIADEPPEVDEDNEDDTVEDKSTGTK